MLIDEINSECLIKIIFWTFIISVVLLIFMLQFYAFNICVFCKKIRLFFEKRKKKHKNHINGFTTCYGQHLHFMILNWIWVDVCLEGFNSNGRKNKFSICTFLFIVCTTSICWRQHDSTIFLLFSIHTPL